MKHEIMIKKAVFCVLVMVIAAMCSITAFAVDGDFGEEPVENTTQVYTDPQPPTEVTQAPPTEVTQPPQTEPTYAPETHVTQAPQTVATTEHHEPQTQPEQHTTQKQIETLPTVEGVTTQYQAPTLLKTISSKAYETNNMAGVVSWVCVIVGVIVIFVVLVSTKASGRQH